MIAEVDHGCRSAGIGCVDCKKWLFESRQEKLGPIYERRVYYDENKREVVDILHDSANRARKVASQTMAAVREAMNI